MLAGIRRSRTTPPGKKSASDADVTWTLLHYIRGERLRDQRDRALIALGMAAALRRSELVALRVEDLQRVPEGLRVHIARSKTDQDGSGQVVAVPGGKRIRPVALVDASARGRSCDNYYRWRKYRATGEELWATTDEPYVFFVCNMGSAITTTKP